MTAIGDAMTQSLLPFLYPLSVALGVFATNSPHSLLFFGEFPSFYWSHVLDGCRDPEVSA